MRQKLLVCVCLAVMIANAVDALAAGSIGIVINGSSINPFSSYLLEILKTEGFGDLKTVPLAGLTLEKLQSYDTIILSEMPLTVPETQLFGNYVSGGGSLVAMRPDSKLDRVFGIVRAAGTTSEGYMRINAATPIGKGLETTASMKTHGVSDHYGLAAGATKVASLYRPADVDTGYASVIQSFYGNGKTLAFSYDLSRCIVYMRQGNPAWAGQEHDGVPGIRVSDRFYDAATSTSWNDISRSGILQADEQMRLLSRVIESLNATKMPIPRFWYFPDAKKSVLVMTGDQDGSSVVDLCAAFNAVKARGGSASAYLLDDEVPSAAQVKSWIADGHEPAIHFDDTSEASNPTWTGMNSAYHTGVAKFRSRYPGAPLPKSVRNHHLVWCGKDSLGEQEFAAQAEIEQNHGIGLDLNNYYWQPSWQGTGGYSIPSGLPMRFAKSTGRILDVFGADTQIVEEGLKDKVAEKYAELLDSSIHHGQYAWIVANFHQVVWKRYSLEVQAILDAAQANAIPIWSGERMNAFVRSRDASTIRNVRWDGRILSFEVDAHVSDHGALTVMVPDKFNYHDLDKIVVAGLGADHVVETVAGSDYAFFTVGDGLHSVCAIYAAERENDATNR